MESRSVLGVPDAYELPRSPGHVFYEKLNAVLEAGGFDRFVEELCAAHYAEDLGRPSIPPGVYFRMLFVGYFEGIDSQRGIAWRWWALAGWAISRCNSLRRPAAM